MAAVLVDHHEGEAFDFARTMVLVPGGRLVDSLERNLLARARSAGHALIPPTIVTPLMLAARLVVPEMPVLNALAARLSWREVLELSHANDDGFEAQVAGVFGGVGAIDARVRLRLTQRLQRLASEVASAMLTMDGVARHEAIVARSDLVKKLAVLRECAARRDALLAKLGAQTRDDALREAVAARRLLTDGLDRIVVLLADPEQVHRALLTGLGAFGVRVEVCVHSTFALDAEGFPLAHQWEQRRFPESILASSSIRVGDGPSESAREAMAAIRAHANTIGRALTSDELAIMAPDAPTRLELERALVLEGSSAATVESRLFAATRLGSLLSRLSELTGEGTAESLAAFVRHDDVATWLREKGEIQSAQSTVSQYRAETLVGSWRDELLQSASSKPLSDNFKKIRDAVAALVQPLSESRAAHEWAQPLREVVCTMVGEDTRGAFANERSGSIRLFDRVLKELADVPAEFAAPMRAAEALSLVLDEAQGQKIRDEELCEGVSIIGWLDAGMADERVLILAGFCEGQVPQGAPMDPVLPDDTRRALGLPSGSRYAARDAWILDGILARRNARDSASGEGGATIFIVPRRTAEGDPLKPSRFLLRVPAVELPARVKRLFPTETPSVRIESVGSEIGRADFRITPPLPGASIQSVRVTAFKTFITCPYLFQLQNDPRLKLRWQDERAVELDAMGFGTLLHAALEGWGKAEQKGGKRTEDPHAIEKSVCAQLDRYVADHFPASSRTGALRVQIEIARSRLRRFALLQSEHAKAGWRVHAVERAYMEAPKHDGVQAPRFPDADGVFLTGRIDRVDILEGVGRFRALDYKSSSSGATPTATHLRISGGKAARTVRWIDLQLPLYRVLLRTQSPSELVAPNDLGYLNLAASMEKSGFAFLEASEGELAEAEELARDIVKEIRAGQFTPSERVPVQCDDPLAPIWGVGMRGSDAESDSAGEASEDDA